MFLLPILAFMLIEGEFRLTPCTLLAERRESAPCEEPKLWTPRQTIKVEREPLLESRGALTLLIVLPAAADLHSSGWGRRHGLREANPALQTVEEHVAIKAAVVVVYVAIVPKAVKSPHRVTRVLGHVVKWGLPVAFLGAAVSNYTRGH